MTLVSAGVGEVYEHQLAVLRRLAPHLGFNDTYLVSGWTEVNRTLHSSPLANVASLLVSNPRKGNPQRPYCCAFKPLVILHAMQRARAGDFILWADASRYATYDGLVNASLSVQDAVAAVQRAGGDGSVHGLLACPFNCRRNDHSSKKCMANGSADKMTKTTLAGFAKWIDDQQAMLVEPHVLDANFILKVNPQNVDMVRDWLSMAIEQPTAFCDSHPQEQTAFALITRARRVPLVNVCEHLNVVRHGSARHGNNSNCHRHTKLLGTFLDALQHRRFTIHPASIRETKRCVD